MKKLTLTLGCLIALAAVCFYGCTKDKDKLTSIKKFFEVQNGTLVAEKFPTTTSNVSIDVYMNSNVIPGGTSVGRVESPVEISKVLVGVPGETGYYELGNACGVCDVMNFTLIINQKVTEDFDVEVAILDGNGEVSRVWTTTLHLIAAGTGKLQVSLSFNNEKDVDLHLIEPNGDHIYYANRRSSNGGELDVDSNAGCSIDGINNENIYYADEAYVEPGTYTVYVDMYSNCDPSTATNYVVSVFYDGALVQTQTGSNPVQGLFPVDEPSNYANLNNLTPVMTFNIGNKGQIKTKSFEPLPLTESAIEKMKMAAEY